MASNTKILIKRSELSNTPGSLNSGELAYSYASNTLFIGTPGSDGYLEIGHRSDLTNLTGGVYGDATHIPIITVDSHGTVTNVSTSAISTTLGLNSDNGSNTMSLLDGTLTIAGSNGVVTSIDPNTSTVTLSTNDTVVRSNTAISVQTIDGAVEINGNLTVLGTQTVVNTETLKVSDPLLYLAGNNNTSDAVDIGLAGTYNDGTQRATGLFRNAGDKDYYVFDNYDKDVTSSNDIDVADSSFRVANLHANLISLLATIDQAVITSANIGGIDVTGNTNLNILNVSGATQLTGLVTAQSGLDVTGDIHNTGSVTVDTDLNVSGTSTLGTANVTSNLVVGGNINLSGDLSVNGTASFGAINLGSGDLQVDTVSANTVTVTNAITVPNGGTGQQSFTSGAIVIGNGTGALSELSNTIFAQTGNSAGNNTITSVTVDNYGRFTDVTYSAIVGLKVDQGGTGKSSFALNGILFGNDSGDLQVTAAPGSADVSGSHQILTATAAGVPVWTTALDGGTF